MTDRLIERLAELIVDEVDRGRAAASDDPLDERQAADARERINSVLTDAVDRLRSLVDDRATPGESDAPGRTTRRPAS